MKLIPMTTEKARLIVELVSEVTYLRSVMAGVSDQNVNVEVMADKTRDNPLGIRSYPYHLKASTVRAHVRRRLLAAELALRDLVMEVTK